ncbi:glycoside hydrolase family 2 protein [Flavobacterium gilvum]|uniref:Beta-galactosidase n=1 Tax=Flavobacterium gilvum TaxID=1492737 RepID=A0AAC9N6Q5_9FLAO|nr:sugar-binding domain-containing protein [Flavobacterium gilvum]AOW09944.1 beta-galactosidase [Flavobacterium gilvum]KFC57917.1 beta-galactosidase [Flavobacterium gilvum]
MNFKSIFYALSFAMLFANFSGAQNNVSDRTKYNFDYGWKLHVGDVEEASKTEFDDKVWTQVSLPYAWNQAEAFKMDIAELSTGIAWYRKSFQLPKDSNDKKIFIEFEGVRQMGEIYVNGTFVGRHENGVMAFGFDLTPFVKPYPQENIIAVKTDNDWKYKEKSTGSGYQWNDKNFNANYGGIPKNVYLYVKSKAYQTLPLYSTLGTTGTYVYATDFDIPQKKAVVNISSQVKNEFAKPIKAQLKVSVADMDGKEVASFLSDTYTLAPNETKDLKASKSLNNLNFWSWGYGYLYKVSSELLVDNASAEKVVIRTGFRKTKFEKGMIYLNDRVIMMHGYAQRTSNEWPSVGMSVPSWMSDYSNSLMVKSNANLVRWMHITPWKQDIESCDRVGLIQAMPAGDSEKDVNDRRWGQRTEVMRDAIIYNRNNPSIIFYESGNESISEEHMQEMLTIKNTYDPFGGRAIGSREMLDSKVAEYGGEMLYINKSAHIPFWATEYSRDEGLRKFWDEFTPPFHKEGTGGTAHKNVNGSKVADASPYNHNQDTHAIEDVVRWYDYWEMRPGTGERVSSGGVNIIFSDSNTHYRGQENYRRSGEVDAMRIPKDNYFAHQVIWDGWVDTDTPNAHIIGHWNYENGVTKDITVVSTADVVELFVNNVSIGKGTQDKRFLFKFKNVQFKPGTIKAIGYDKSGKKVCENEIRTAGKPYALKLSTIERPGGTLANANDLAIIQVEVVDEKGNRCPTALNMIDFKVEGEGTYLGGIAQGSDNFIGKTSLPVECGVNRILVKANDKAGEILIKATSESLKGDAVTVKTIKADTSKLSTTMTSENLPSYIAKGPTPKTPSFKKTRNAIAIIGVKTDSNQEDVAKSYDDNELTEWSNGDGIAKIEYELERKATINQVVLKLSGWRSKKYPLRISIDGKQLFDGITPTSLGYVTLDVKPTKGKTVQIELMENSKNSNDINLVEITGKVDDGLLKKTNSKTPQLPIVEIEFYESIR